MSKKILVVLLAIVGVAIIAGVMPANIKAITVDELRQQIASLQAQINQLIAQLQQTQGEQPVKWCHTFNTNLGMNSNSDDVGALHKILRDEGIEGSNPAHPDSQNFRNTFEEDTASMVVGLQEKYASEILKPYGLKHGTGYVGKSTRAKLNKLYGCNNNACAMDAKLCSDGSYVSRSGPNCDFYSCPTIAPITTNFPPAIKPNVSTSSSGELGGAVNLPNPPVVLPVELSDNTPWYNNSWLYRKKITIDHTKVSADLNNFPVLVNLSSDPELASHTQSNGGDILFTASDGITQIGHEVEKYNSATGNLIAWVEVPALSSITDTNIYAYYGNNKKDYETAVSDSFVRTKQGDRIIPEATGDFSNRFKALHYQGNYNRTYMVYGDQDSNPHITYYDYNSGEFAAPVEIATLNDPIADSHNHPAMAIDNNGFIYVFYGSHDTLTKMRKSVHAEDISAWGDEIIVDTVSTYPNVFFIGDTLYMFYRQRGDGSLAKWGYKISSDKGATWSSFNQVIIEQNNTPYVIMTKGNETPTPYIYMSWLISEPRVTQPNKALWRDLYFAYSDNGGTRWRKANGTIITNDSTVTPINETNAEKILDYDYLHGWINDIQIDRSGKPCILFLTGDGAEFNTGKNVLKIAKWTGSAWSINDNGITTVNSRYDMGILKIDGVNDYKVFVPNGGNPIGAEAATYGGEVIEEWNSADGINWTYAGDIAREAIAKGSVIVPLEHNTLLPVVSKEIEIIWSSGESKFTGKVNTWGSAKNLLPKLRPWDSNYKLVYHFNESSGQHISNVPTAKRSNQVSVKEQGTAIGKIGNADSFNGTSNIIKNLYSPDFDLTSAITFEAWVKKPITGLNTGRTIAGKGGSSPWDKFFPFYLMIRDNGKMAINLGNGTTNQKPESAGAVSDNTFTHIVATASGKEIRYYLNGALSGGAIPQIVIPKSNRQDLFTGALDGAGSKMSFFDGIMDELRISNVARSADWISTEYNNQNNPDNFYSLSSEKTLR